LNNNKTVLLVAGSGKQPKYRALAKRLGVEDRVIFLGPLPDIQQALSIADVAVLPTYYDPCSRFILEALAQAKPVITTQFNGAAGRYTDNRHGKIIDDPRNIKALVVAMDHLSQTQNAQEAADAIITDNLRDQISIAKHAERMVQLYETIASERTTD
jgi:UDP-glucose:(heptosyl)LPS alpha-1,3-glucosyltransferase